jgi:hypothetical protein
VHGSVNEIYRNPLRPSGLSSPAEIKTTGTPVARPMVYFKVISVERSNAEELYLSIKVLGATRK